MRYGAQDCGEAKAGHSSGGDASLDAAVAAQRAQRQVGAAQRPQAQGGTVVVSEAQA